jgi:hypothetical protein
MSAASRGLFERARLGGCYDPLSSVIFVAQLDESARNHATAEGHADPYPPELRPDSSREAVESRRESSEIGSPPHPLSQRRGGAARRTPYSAAVLRITKPPAASSASSSKVGDTT